MSSCRRPRARVALATAALLELCVVIASPLWHHTYHETAPVAAFVSGAPVDLHVCNTDGHASHPGGGCPICLSHRLLTNGLMAPSVTPSVPAVSGVLSLADILPSGGSRTEPILPRGPPTT